MKSQSCRWIVGALMLALGELAAQANVKPAALFADNMVLQQGVSAPIWGTADPGERVTIVVKEQQLLATAGDDGRWSAKLPVLSVGDPLEITISGKDTITLKNVLVGEVWVCAGQSNMLMNMSGVANSKQEIAQAEYPLIRLFTENASISLTPKSTCAGKWTVCSPQTVGGFSATGYFFAREVYKTLNVPIGMIAAAYNGSPAQAWTDRQTLAGDPEMKAFLDVLDKSVQTFTGGIYDQYGPQLRDWLQACETAKAQGQPLPIFPLTVSAMQADPRGLHLTPTGLYNGMITPLIPYAIAGAIWYQGESNAWGAVQYRKLFPLMIQGWRKAWGQGDFPFLFVQLPNYMATAAEPGPSAWASMREAQQAALALPKTGMAVTIDVGDAASIHPLNKQDVGKRLGLVALANVYGKAIEYWGPTYEAMQIDGDKIRIRYTHLGGGLVTKDNLPVKGFAIAGDDKQFVWADAVIDGDTVVVRSDKVAKPVAVRYAWADNPICNVYSRAELPATPFRTDTW